MTAKKGPESNDSESYSSRRPQQDNELLDIGPLETTGTDGRINLAETISRTNIVPGRIIKPQPKIEKSRGEIAQENLERFRASEKRDDEGQLLKAVILSQKNGKRLWRKFIQDYNQGNTVVKLGKKGEELRVLTKTGDQVEQWQKQWWMDNVNSKQDFYAVAENWLASRHTEKAREATVERLNDDQIRGLNKVLSGFRYKIAQELNLNGAKLKVAAIRSLFGLDDSSLEAWGKVGDKVRVEGKGEETKLVFERQDHFLDLERKANIQHLASLRKKIGGWEVA